MKILEQRILRGPNLYARFPCLLSRIDLESLEGVSSADIAGFTDNLGALLPSLQTHRCSVGHAGGFLARLRDGTFMAHIVEHVALALQCEAGMPAGFGRTRKVKDAPGQYRIVCAYGAQSVGCLAFDVSMQMVEALAAGRTFDLAPHLFALREMAGKFAIGTSTAAVINAARKQDVPVLRLREEGNLFQLGWGARRKRLRATITGDTDHIAVGIAGDKQLTKTLLDQAGVPTPRGRTAQTVDDALTAARSLRGPVTVKPLDSNQGKGVTTDCRTPSEVERAFDIARAYSRHVIVERYIKGKDYRVLVVGGKVAAVACRRPPNVHGDGRRTVRELVDIENARPERGEGHTNILTRIPLDQQAEATAQRQGLTLDSIAPAGMEVVLRGNANLSTGGTAEDVTDIIDAQTRLSCERVARIIGLDVAGIDLVCEDISRPLEAQGGCVIEVNAAPGIRMHEFPSAGRPRDVGKAILQSMFGEDNGRIPVIAVTGTNGKTTTTLLIAETLRRTGKTVGATTTEGIFINGNPIDKGDCTGYWSGRTLLCSPEVDVAVLETARGGILKRGLAYDKCDVAVVLNISADHLGMDGIDTLSQLARVKAVVANSASRAVVLNAEDRYCVRMAARIGKGVEILYFALRKDCAVLRRHLLDGGRGVYLDNDAIWIHDRDGVHLVIEASAVPMTMGGNAEYNIANAMAAVASLAAMSLDMEQVRTGLRNFRCDPATNPLRSNLFRVRDFQMIVDYAHNPAAYAAVGRLAALLKEDGGTLIALVTAPGDRRDADLRDIGQTCGRVFDHTIVYEAEPRGRPAGQNAQLIVEGAMALATSSDRVECELDVQQAFGRALRRCRGGDVLVFAYASSLTALISPLRAFDEAAAARFATQIPATQPEFPAPMTLES